MCMGLILLSRLEGIVYGATAILFGHHLDKQGKVPLYKEGIIQVRKGVGEQESVNLLKQFFKQKRKLR